MRYKAVILALWIDMSQAPPGTLPITVLTGTESDFWGKKSPRVYTMYTVALHLMVYQNNQHSFFSTSLTITLCLKIEYNPIFDEKNSLFLVGR